MWSNLNLAWKILRVAKIARGCKKLLQTPKAPLKKLPSTIRQNEPWLLHTPPPTVMEFEITFYFNTPSLPPLVTWNIWFKTGHRRVSLSCSFSFSNVPQHVSLTNVSCKHSLILTSAVVPTKIAKQFGPHTLQCNDRWPLMFDVFTRQPSKPVVLTKNKINK